MKVKPGSKTSSYQPSGKISAMAWIFLPLVCGVLLPLVGALYAIILWYLPITFFNPLITVLFAIAIIIVHNLLVIEYGKVRNIQFANFSGHMAVASALYAHWIVWIALADGNWNLIEGSYYFLMHPSELASMIWKVNQTGTWWGPGGTWHGWPLMIIWIIETLIVYFWVMSTVKKKVRMPFSEVSQKWLKPDELPENEFQERKPTIEPSQAESVGKSKQTVKMNPPFQAEELINSLNRKGFKVSFKNYLRENPDPRENSFYEQSSVTIGSKQIDLWNNSALYIEESNLVCLLAESVSASWHYDITIVDINSLKIESSRPRFHYQHEVEMIGSSKNMFTIKAKDSLLRIDVSNFPELKIAQSPIDRYDIQIENPESKLTDAVEKPENTQPKTTTKIQQSNRETYCSIAGDTIISNAPAGQEKKMLISSIRAIVFYKGFPVEGHESLYLIIRDVHSVLSNEFYIEIGSKGYQEVIDFLFKKFELNENEFYRLTTLNERLFSVLWRAPIEDSFEMLLDQKFSEDFHLGYEIQTNVPLFLPWSTTRKEILNNPDIPKTIMNETQCIECPIRFGPIVVKGPHSIFENEVKLYLLHKVKGGKAFDDLKRSIESLGTPVNIYYHEDGANKIYRCRIEYVDFKIYYDRENAEIPELNVTQLIITKVPTTPIDLMKFNLHEIAVEEYLTFAGDYDDGISFTDGITTVPEDVKKIFEAKSGLWVNHTHQKIGFTANGYCSIYSITDIAKIVFVDSIGRYKDPRQFRIILKDRAERTIFRDGYWSTYDDETRKIISEVTGLPIEDQLIDNMYMDDDNWGSQDRH